MNITSLLIVSYTLTRWLLDLSLFLFFRWSSRTRWCRWWSGGRSWPRRRGHGTRGWGVVWKRHGAPETPAVCGGGGGAAEEVSNRTGGTEQTPDEWDQPLQIWPPASTVHAVVQLADVADGRAAQRQPSALHTGRGGAYQHRRPSPGGGAETGEASDWRAEREGEEAAVREPSAPVQPAALWPGILPRSFLLLFLLTATGSGDGRWGWRLSWVPPHQVALCCQTVRFPCENVFLQCAFPPGKHQ